VASITGPSCTVSNDGKTCTPQYIGPTQFYLYLDNLFGTFVFVPPPGSTIPLSVLSISPPTKPAGGPDLTLTIIGSGFLASSVVLWNGSQLSTTLNNGDRLTAVVPANLVSFPGMASVIVQNPGGLPSGALPFTISAPTPVLTSVSPNSASAGSSSFTLTANGSGFLSGSKVLWNTTPLSTSYVSGNELMALVSSSFIASPGFATIAVQNPGGPTSSSLAFTINPSNNPVTLTLNGIVNAASYASGSVSPGEIITILGSFPGPKTPIGLQLDGHGFVATIADGEQVLFDGVPAPIIYAAAGQVSCIVPYEVNGEAMTQVQVSYQGQTSNSVGVPVAVALPGIFTLNASGKGQGSIINQDGTVNSVANPAAVDSIILVYETGESQTNPAGVDGKIGAVPLPQPLKQPVTATVGGVPASVLYAGGAAGMVEGVMQVNVQIPQGVSSGSVPIVLNIGGTTSQSNVTLVIR
jgi:uncharacterized protein (TIGR03437 family)